MTVQNALNLRIELQTYPITIVADRPEGAIIIIFTSRATLAGSDLVTKLVGIAGIICQT
jgi:hypothetical protein